MGVKKAFLSHSSSDKAIVRPIFERLTAAKCHYDEQTFEQADTSAEAIFKGVKGSDLFALFVSQASVDSPWVQYELKLVDHFYASGKIKKVFIFLLDDVSSDKLPESLRIFVYKKTRKPGLIADVIRGALFELAASEQSTLNLFLGRDTEIRNIQNAMAGFDSASPSVIAVSGSEGIGRRSTVKKAVSGVYPMLSESSIEAALGESEGDIECYRQLLNNFDAPNLRELIEKVEYFQQEDEQSRAAMLADLISKIAAEKRLVAIRGRNSIISDSGEYVRWLNRVFGNLEPGPWPKLIVITSRTVPPAKRLSYPNVFFQPIGSLDEQSSKNLLAIWLKHYGIDGDTQLLVDIAQHVSGHPRTIQVAAKLAGEFGKGRLLAQRHEFLLALRSQARTLINDLSIDPAREQMLALFVEYEYLSHEDLAVANPKQDEESQQALGYLVDHGILESDGHYVRIAPYLPIAFTRDRWSSETREYLTHVRRLFIDHLTTVSTTEHINISTLDSAVISSLQSDSADENPLLQRYLLPSHLLRVARSFYDKRDYSRTIDLANRAYEAKGKLNFDAQIEALRLIGLSSVRMGDNKNLDHCLEELSREPDMLSRRNWNFINGFKERYEGKPEVAYRYYHAAYELGGSKNFNILRELAQLCRVLRKLPEGEAFARAALNIAPNNPYVLDNLIEIIIERHWGNKKFLQENDELQDLLARLSTASKFEKRSYFEGRFSHLQRALGDKQSAAEWARKAAAETPHHAPVLLQLARAELANSDYKRARDAITKAKEELRNAGNSADKRHITDLDIISIDIEIDAGAFDVARTLLGRAHSLPSDIKSETRKKIDAAEAYLKK